GNVVYAAAVDREELPRQRPGPLHQGFNAAGHARGVGLEPTAYLTVIRFRLDVDQAVGIRLLPLCLGIAAGQVTHRSREPISPRRASRVRPDRSCQDSDIW